MDANVSERISYPSVMPVPTINGMKIVPKPADRTGDRGEGRSHGATALSRIRGQTSLPSPECWYSTIAKLLRHF